ncbi:hypothetical protein NPIL_620291 [Nephila pilipes]|uniref:Uncharacterized protein n=1 Tax=Nephila pilipes TaxID=299642 RepID=A0A8X6MPT0_NEPPI|nr:hypothetical protein NPIL_620291 [Nephila pilipes]
MDGIDDENTFLLYDELHSDTDTDISSNYLDYTSDDSCSELSSDEDLKLQEMKRNSSSIDVSSERVCFNDDDDTKVDSSFSDDAVPLHHFHLCQDIYATVTYFANAAQIHLRQYG